MVVVYIEALKAKHFYYTRSSVSDFCCNDFASLDSFLEKMSDCKFVFYFSEKKIHAAKINSYRSE